MAETTSPSSGSFDALAAAQELESAAIQELSHAQRHAQLFRGLFHRLRTEVGKRVVGQQEVVDLALTCLFADGHLLLEGVPGLGKTLLVRALAEATGVRFSRIQFTPDVMPADITGTSVLTENPVTLQRCIEFRPGPIFAQLVLADEVNRASPKTQSALLEAMQERSVTAGGETRPLGRPFFVMATQNPIEQEGTYPLPEAQLDRFLLKVVVPAAKREELHEILSRTTRDGEAALEQVVDHRGIQAAQKLARRIPIASEVQDWCVRLVLATHPDSEFCPESLRRLIRAGSSPRGAQALASSARVCALMQGRFAVSFSDVKRVARAALRHRIHRSFEAEAEGISNDAIAQRLIAGVPTIALAPSAPRASTFSNGRGAR